MTFGNNHHGEVFVVRVFLCLCQVFLVVRKDKVICAFRRGLEGGYIG